jgi:hypothetical protein
MALRRVQMLTETPYWQSLGFPYGQPLAVTEGNAIVTRLSTEPRPVTVQLAAQYSQSGDNLNLIAYLERIPGVVIQAGSAQFVLTELSGDGSWTAGMTDSIIGTIDALGRLTASLPAQDVITNLCMGKSTLKVQVIMQRAGKSYKKEIYVNHLGIGEAAAWLKNKVNFLETTKKDE